MWLIRLGLGLGAIAFGLLLALMIPLASEIGDTAGMVIYAVLAGAGLPFGLWLLLGRRRSVTGR